MTRSAALRKSHAEATSNRSEAGVEEWKLLTPIPADAPRDYPPRVRGKPSSCWVYRDNYGRRLFLVCRFDRPHGRKEFAPLTFCQGPDGRRGMEMEGTAEPSAALRARPACCSARGSSAGRRRREIRRRRPKAVPGLRGDYIAERCGGRRVVGLEPAGGARCDDLAGRRSTGQRLRRRRCRPCHSRWRGFGAHRHRYPIISPTNGTSPISCRTA